MTPQLSLESLQVALDHLEIFDLYDGKRAFADLQWLHAALTDDLPPEHAVTLDDEDDEVALG
jgi:hypothetical protein